MGGKHLYFVSFCFFLLLICQIVGWTHISKPDRNTGHCHESPGASQRIMAFGFWLLEAVSEAWFCVFITGLPLRAEAHQKSLHLRNPFKFCNHIFSMEETGLSIHRTSQFWQLLVSYRLFKIKLKTSYISVFQDREPIKINFFEFQTNRKIFCNFNSNHVYSFRLSTIESP